MNKLHEEIRILNTNMVGEIIGKGYTEQNGKVEERYIIKLDAKKITIQDIIPFISEIVIDPSKIYR